MVKVLDIGKVEFLELIKDKQLLCFGAGRYLQQFIMRNPGIQISGIIDTYNYWKNPHLTVHMQNIPVWSLEKLRKEIRVGQTVILVTSLAIEEIVEQLDREEKFDNVFCCIEAAIDECEEDRLEPNIRKFVSALAQRTEASIAKENFAEMNKEQVQKRYQIWEYFLANETAGCKARVDIREIVGGRGYQVVKLRFSRGEKGTPVADISDKLVREDWLRCLALISENAYILIQHPAPGQTRLPEDILWKIKKEKKANFICLVHDVDALRGNDHTGARQEEFDIMKNISDVFIVHNDVMRQFYIGKGVSEHRIVSLQIFDYLHKRKNQEKKFEKSVTIAGYLGVKKAAYLKELKKLSPLRFHLYGPEFPVDEMKNVTNIEYHGSVLPEILPDKLDRGFGLIWDGNSIDSCSGSWGEYLRYNNPHKLSLYLSAGLPVIIWSEAAEANFVINNGVGIAVDSLYEINNKFENLTLKEYERMVRNAEKIASQLKTGEFTIRALEKAEKILQIYTI